jgi:LysR family transcriptional regulator, cell division regulator
MQASRGVIACGEGSKKTMESIDLMYFAVVARLGSITKAARPLDTVQSNVTQRIQRLESELGVALFHRHGRGVSLTPAGARLLPYAASVENTMDEARRAVLEQAEPAGPLCIGSMETTAALHLPRVLVDYALKYPKVDLTLRTGTTSGLIDEVCSRTLHGALVAGPVDHVDLVGEPMVREELVVVTAPGVRQARSQPSWAARRGETKIAVFRHGCAYRERLERALIRQGVTRIRRMELGSLEAILGCVRAGIGISLLPRAVVQPLQREAKVELHELPDGEGLVDTVFVRRRDAFQSAALAGFVHRLRRHLSPAAEAQPAMA